jgi:hypothetical protein
MSEIVAVTYHLVSEHEHSLELELALAVIEEVLERGTQQVNDHHIVISFHAEPMNVWNSN